MTKYYYLNPMNLKPAFAFLCLTIFGCGIRSTETNSTTDSLATDTVALVADSATITEELNDPDGVADYAGNYRLASSSAAEQARLSITFKGDKSFEFSLDFGVADFCSEQHSGSFILDDSNTGTYPVDEVRKFIFKPEAGTFAITDDGGQFGVGSCNVSGTFMQCDGECEPISWEGMGEEVESEYEADGEVSADTVQ